MKTKIRAALLTAAFTFFLPLSARSEIKAGSFEVTPFGGYNFFEDEQNLENAPLWGGRIGYNFTRNFGLEGVFDYMWTNVDNRTITGFMEGQYRSPMNDVDLTFYHLDAIYHLIPEGNFNPFVAIGFGGAHYSPDISDKDMADFNVGVGAKYWLAENIALRIDVRDYMVTEIFQETYHNVAVLAGITFAFGGESKAEPARVAKYEAKSEPEVEKPGIVLVSEPKAEEKIMTVASEPMREEKMVVLALEDIHFSFDKSTLTQGAREILKRNIRILKENPQTEVRIAEYTSASGTGDYNQRLSERRTKAVSRYTWSMKAL